MNEGYLKSGLMTCEIPFLYVIYHSIFLIVTSIVSWTNIFIDSTSKEGEKLNVMAGEILTLLLMSIALGMDSFSVGLSMGMFSLRMKQMVKISVTVGAFHILMPLGGMVAGRFISSQFGEMAGYAGGLLLIILGVSMFITGIKGESDSVIAPVGFGLLVFAVSVSLDSLSVGLTLGIYGARQILAVSLFGIVATILTFCGLLLGRKVQGLLGSYGQVLGGSILLAFGMKLLLS